MTTREWLKHGWPDDAYFSTDYGGVNDDEFFWYFKRADFYMLKEAFEMLKNGGAMQGFRIVTHEQPFTVNAISRGFRVYPIKPDFEFMDIEEINRLLIYFFSQRGVELTALPLWRLLNLKPHW